MHYNPNITTKAAPRVRDRDATVEPALWGVHPSAAYIGISRAKLFRLVAEGRLKSVRLDGRRLFRKADLDAFIAGLGA